MQGSAIHRCILSNTLLAPLLWLVLGIIAAMLSGCGGSEESTETSATPPISSSPIPSPPAAPPASPQAPTATVAVTDRGTAIGPIAEMSMSATGGKLVSSDGRLTVDVPVGALSSSQKITIQALTNESPGGSGMAYRLLPEGVNFTAPVKLTFNYRKSDIIGSEPLALKIAYQDKQGRWNAIKKITLDEVAKTVSVETTHFSDWSMLKGYQLTPASASIGAGKSVDLEIVFCDNEGDGDLTSLMYQCSFDPDTSLLGIADWAVNGAPGGGGTVGTVVASPGKDTARYNAPNSAPPNNPVSVSVDVQGKFGKTVLVSHVWVATFPPLSGTITATQVLTEASTGTLTLSTTANVTFKYDVAEQLYRPTSGNVVSRIDYVNALGGCGYHVSFAGAIGALDGWIIFYEDARDPADALKLYVAAGRTAAAHTGTTDCAHNGKPGPLTIDPAAADWWPAPPAVNAFSVQAGARSLRVGQDGLLDEFFTWTTGPGEFEITVRWTLWPD